MQEEDVWTPVLDIPDDEFWEVRRQNKQTLLAYVPGEVSLWPTLTGGEVIDLLARLRGGLDPARKAELLKDESVQKKPEAIRAQIVEGQLKKWYSQVCLVDQPFRDEERTVGDLITEKIATILFDGKVDQEEMPAYSELTRRLGFEYNGMVLHEYYFDNLQSGGGTGDPAQTSQFAKAAEASFGNYDIWKADFVGIGKMRGVGWAICYQNPANGRLSNHWITLHETGNVAGFNPILVMDVWEHAFLLDYKPAERPKYIEAFFSNINWNAVEDRLKKRVLAADPR